MWKVYRVESDEILKAGFATEDEAKEWLDRHNPDDDDDAVVIDEMDSDEEELWVDTHEADSFVAETPESEEDEADIEGLNFRGGAVDLGDDDEFFDDDEDFDGDEKDEDETDEDEDD